VYASIKYSEITTISIYDSSIKVITRGTLMDALELLTKLWPIIFAIISLVIVLAKIDQRVAILEEKVKTLFELVNKIRDQH
jgi:hypothetical protein